MSRFWEAVARAIIEAVPPHRLIEIGVAAGVITAKVLDYCATSAAFLRYIDPHPEAGVEERRQRHGERLAIRQPRRLYVLGNIHNADVVLIDGNRRSFTVYHELKLIEESALNKKRDVSTAGIA